MRLAEALEKIEGLEEAQAVGLTIRKWEQLRRIVTRFSKEDFEEMEQRMERDRKFFQDTDKAIETLTKQLEKVLFKK